MNASVFALAEYDGELIAGGFFTKAGGKVAAHLGAWTKPACAYSVEPGHVSCGAHLDLVDVVLLGNYLDGLIDANHLCLDCAGDVDQDGDIDEDDYDLLYDIAAGIKP
jgi:hypothetical protein